MLWAKGDELTVAHSESEGRIAYSSGPHSSRREFIRVGAGAVAAGITSVLLPGERYADGAEEVVMTESRKSDTDDPGIVTIKSKLSFSQTVESLKSAFQSHGIKVFTVIDQMQFGVESIDYGTHLGCYPV